MDIIPSQDTHTLEVSNERDSVNALYLGCGHLALKFKEEIILIDPFFSTHGFIKSKLSSDGDALKKYKGIIGRHQFDFSKTQNVWVAHTHYDHMMDIPLMLKENIFPRNTTIMGNEFGDDILVNFLTPNQYHALMHDEVYDPKTQNSTSRWFYSASRNIRVMPILSDHAPHYKLGPIPFHLMKGKLRANYFFSHLTDAKSTTKRGRWKEGKTYSFLIDLMKSDTVAFRLFIQTSGSHYPLGRPPADVLKDREVDVAFLCVASANFVKPYPIEILDTLKPNKVVFIHWEDFFRKPLDFEGARFVRFTNFRKLDRRLKRKGYDLNREDYVMPRPGTMLTIH